MGYRNVSSKLRQGSEDAISYIHHIVAVRVAMRNLLREYAVMGRSVCLKVRRENLECLMPRLRRMEFTREI